jgi:Fe-S cluster biogenesis protein NfuA
MTNSEVLINIQSTPNPNAWKFILDRPVLMEGKASFSTPEEAFGNQMALDLLNVQGVSQVHFFTNVITVTHGFDVEAETVKQNVISVIKTRMAVHDPNYRRVDAKMARRAELPPDLQKIESILDRTVRPGLQGDGGDLEIVKYENKELHVLYQGACGTCPSSTSGTLMAIESILREEFDPEIIVTPVAV